MMSVWIRRPALKVLDCGPGLSEELPCELVSRGARLDSFAERVEVREGGGDGAIVFVWKRDWKLEGSSLAGKDKTTPAFCLTPCSFTSRIFVEEVLAFLPCAIAPAGEAS